MEYRPNSNPKRSVDFGPDIRSESPNDLLREHFFMKRTITLWPGPRHVSYNSIAQRLRSYEKWSHDKNPTPESLSEAGFYYAGKSD
jgi:hypothetical protein